MSARLEVLQRSFARHLRAGGSSDRTVVIYGQAITFFSRWLEAQGREATVEELTRAAIREWLAHLSDINEASTVKTRYRGLLRFCSWLVDEDDTARFPLRAGRFRRRRNLAVAVSRWPTRAANQRRTARRTPT